jgi:hypothetical protein
MTRLPVVPVDPTLDKEFRALFCTAAIATILLLLTACGAREKTVESSGTSPPPAAAPTQPAAKAQPKACEMVTQAEMSAILGSPVVAAADEHTSDKTDCIYTAATGVSPRVEFSVNWGDGEAAMAAMGMMNRKEPGITSPYDGIGDQAASVGPALMIRTGDDLVTLVFSGVDDAPAKARKIFETAKARM